MASKPTVFLSYAWSDRPLAEAITQALQGAGLSVWSDALIPAGDAWDVEIEKALQHSDVVVLLISPEFLKSSHSLYEAGYAIHKSRQGAGRVLPVLVDSSDITDISLPLSNIHVLDGRGRGEAEIAELVRAALRDLT